MKKIVYILSIGFMVGCGVTQPSINSSAQNIKHSDILISAPDTSVVWIMDTQHGNLIARTWKSGAYGDKTKVVMLDSVEFEEMSKTAVPCTCSSNYVKK
jgi:hypothetical protein